MGRPDDRWERDADAVAASVGSASARAVRPGSGSGMVPDAVRARVEPVLGADLGGVRIRGDSVAQAAAQDLGASAFTYGNQIWLGRGSAPTDLTLMAHELAHVVQQSGPDRAHAPAIQCQTAKASPAATALTGPLTDADWRAISLYLAHRSVPSGPLTSNPETNADLIAGAIFCGRYVGSPGWGTGDPLVCVDNDVTTADPRVKAIRAMVTARRLLVPDPLTEPLNDAELRVIGIWQARGATPNGPLTADPDANADLIAGTIFCGRLPGCVGSGPGPADPRVQAIKAMITRMGPLVHWPAVPAPDRMAYVMNRLITVHHYPPAGAAGIVGNMSAESRVLPSMLEDGSDDRPMRAKNFAGKVTDFAPDEVMKPGSARRPTGPLKPGVGLVQWTSEPNRSDLFSGGSGILFDMDGQVDHLVSELQTPPHAALNARLLAPGITVNDAADDFVFSFEQPGDVFTPDRKTKLPRADPAVQAVFNKRRPRAQDALTAWKASTGQGS